MPPLHSADERPPIITDPSCPVVRHGGGTRAGGVPVSTTRSR